MGGVASKLRPWMLIPAPVTFDVSQPCGSMSAELEDYRVDTLSRPRLQPSV